jgi:hypothetical protein
MAGLAQPQPTQSLSLPSSIRWPVDRGGLKRIAVVIAENEGVDGRLPGCDSMLHQVVAENAR